MRDAGARGLAALYARRDDRPSAARRVRAARLSDYARGARIDVGRGSDERVAALCCETACATISCRRCVALARRSMLELLAIAREAARWRDDVEAFVDRNLDVRSVDRRDAGLDVAR